MIRLLINLAIAGAVCWYVDRRATMTEFYMTNLVVDAATGFSSWRRHVERFGP